MKKIFALLVLVQVFALGVLAGDDIILETVLKTEPPVIHQTEIPVHANISDKVVGVHFDKDVNANIVISGGRGTVYSRQVNAAAAQSIYVDLGNEADGVYNISIQDADGNEFAGDFISEKE